MDITGFNGLGLHLGNVSRLSHARTRSISPENFIGEKDKGGMAIQGAGQDLVKVGRSPRQYRLNREKPANWQAWMDPVQSNRFG